MTFRLIAKEVAPGPRRARDVHAQADRGRVRFGDALAPVALRRRRERVPRSRRRVRPVEGREALHRRAARARERDRRDHQPVGQLLQAADPRLRGARLQVLGAQQPLRARARAAAEEGQERLDAHRVPRARPGVQPVPRVLSDARGRAQGDRRGLRAAARSDRQHLRAHRRRAARRRHHAAAGVAARRARRDGALGADGRGARRARVRELPREQAAGVDRVQGRTSRRSRSTARSERCRARRRRVAERRRSRFSSSRIRRRRCSRRRSTSPDSGGRRWRTPRSRCRANRSTGGRARSSAPTTIPKARSRCAAHLRKGDARVESILLLVSGAQLHELEHRDDLFDDFCLSPFHPKEIEARLPAPPVPRRARGNSPSSRRTPISCSTSRRTRPRSAASRSTSPTWSTSS